MSEEKIIKHSQKAVHIIAEKTGWRHKILGLLEEIAIIIFAVSVTLALHNWNDARNERKMEREFLTGIRSDLKNDVLNVNAAVGDLKYTVNYYNTAWKQIINRKIDAAYIDTNSGQLATTSYFVFDNGRFESFKSSGYLRLIENQTLLKHLTSLYMVSMPFQVHADEMIYGARRDNFNTYIGTKAPVDSNKVVHVSKLLNDPAVKYQIMYYGGYLQERIRQKTELGIQINKMIAEIDKELDK